MANQYDLLIVKPYGPYHARTRTTLNSLYFCLVRSLMLSLLSLYALFVCRT